MGPEFGQQSVYRARIRAYNILSSSLTSWVHWTSFMACWVWKLYGFSHRPGAGWQHFGQNFSSKRNAKTFHRVLAEVLKREKEFINWEFKKTIAWGKRAKWHKAQTHRMRFLMFAEAMDLELEHGLMEEQHDLMAESSSWWQRETTQADGRTTRADGRVKQMQTLGSKNTNILWEVTIGDTRLLLKCIEKVCQ